MQLENNGWKHLQARLSIWGSVSRIPVSKLSRIAEYHSVKQKIYGGKDTPYISPLICHRIDLSAVK
jgi:hypothetical protein